MVSVASELDRRVSPLTEVGEVTESMILGREGAMHVLEFSGASRLKPAFLNNETIGFVAKGSVRLFMLSVTDVMHGATLPAGSFFRVPTTIVYWIVNGSDEPALVVTGIVKGPDVPGQDRGGWGNQLATPWEEAADLMAAPRFFPADKGCYAITREEALLGLERGLKGLVCLGDEVPAVTKNVYGTTNLTKQAVYGHGGSIMVGTRPPGYHSTPHIHPAEQLNVVSMGAVRGYCMETAERHVGVECKAGGAFRFPYMSVHWAWNFGDETMQLIELHAPSLNGGDVAAGTVPLFGPDELEPRPSSARNIFLDLGPGTVRDVEGSGVVL